MGEKSTDSSMVHLADTIESRVLLSLSAYIEANPDVITREAQNHLEQDILSPEAVLDIDTYREQEQRKAVKLSRDKLTYNIAILILAHAWQEENDQARTQHKRLPH